MNKSDKSISEELDLDFFKDSQKEKSAKTFCNKEGDLFANMGTLILVLLTFFSAALLLWEPSLKVRPDISKLLNENGFDKTFRKLNIDYIYRNGASSDPFNNMRGLVEIKIGSDVVKCRDSYLPYKYKIELKDGNLVYSGDDLISNSVNYKTLESAIQNAVMCAYDYETKLIKDKVNRESWKSTSENVLKDNVSLAEDVNIPIPKRIEGVDFKRTSQKIDGNMKIPPPDFSTLQKEEVLKKDRLISMELDTKGKVILKTVD